MVRTVLVVMAMDVEAAPVRAALDARPLARPDWVGPMPFSWWEAERAGSRVVLSVNGRDPRHGVDAIGTEAAALATFAAARAVAPDLVVSAGTAGGWQRHGATVGDVYLSGDRFVYHDRRIDLPGFDAYGVGSWPGVDTSGLAARLGLRRGIVTSGDSLDESAEDAARILASGAEVKEMEAAAVAWVADLLAIPVLAVKAVTDLVDHPAPTAEQFIANLAVATERLRDAVVAVLDEVAGRPLGSPPA
jgi:5'-methylthioadenosine nucleosidase